ncbi:hypothetical protein Catovirus_2_148 [Catovirus CTV1]|uniref:Uncharacterized protein n=1 Tax=Catovirus CTV1 TaxID=1977631 RepID=A0A1V0SBX1_9VIRU|nr:hypothetical protein Catovirus_2_148 [Catovirus CTV1]
MFVNKFINKFINNNEYNTFFNKYKHVLSGLRTVEDCFLILEKSSFPTEQRKLLLGLIHGKKSEKSIDYVLMSEIINDLNSYKYREEVYAHLPQFMTKTNNLAQIKTFTRIANSKPLKPVCVSVKEIKNAPIPNVLKPCPHCGHMCSAPKFSEYIICGFGDHSYDWEGCGKDWCFKCGKVLCKSWNNDMLFIEENRFHDMECCKRHSISSKKLYPEEYCQCNNNFVKRNVVSSF